MKSHDPIFHGVHGNYFKKLISLLTNKGKYVIYIFAVSELLDTRWEVTMMAKFFFPCIDMEAFGKKFRELRRERNFSVKFIQEYFGFAAPQAVYKRQKGQAIPSTDHLLALSILFDVPMEELLVYKKVEMKEFSREYSREIFLHFSRMLWGAAIIRCA